MINMEKFYKEFSYRLDDIMDSHLEFATTQQAEDGDKIIEKVKELFIEMLKEKEEEKTIYNLNLHESLDIGCFTVLRVPAGWIYIDKDLNTSVFVPFDNQFMIKVKW